MTGPLAAVRVVTLAPNLPGPVAAHRLTVLGAGVVKVEPPGGDPLAPVAPDFYRELTAGQEVRTIDLKQEGGRRELDTLLADADLLLTSSRPRALDRLGLSWSRLHADFPRLSHVAVVGHSGVESDRPGHDLTYQASAGTLTPPQMPTVPVADLAGAERVVGEALALVLAAGRTGSGGHRVVSLAEVTEDFAAPLRHRLTGPGTVLGGGVPVYAMYRARDGWVALAAIEPHFAAGLAAQLEVDPMDGQALEKLFATRSAGEWEQWAGERDLPLVRVRTILN